MHQFPQQPSLRPCPECGGRRVTGQKPHDLILRAELRIASGHPLNVILPTTICTNCGQISLYTDHLPEFLEELQKHPDRYRY